MKIGGTNKKRVEINNLKHRLAYVEDDLRKANLTLNAYRQAAVLLMTALSRAEGFDPDE